VARRKSGRPAGVGGPVDLHGLGDEHVVDERGTEHPQEQAEAGIFAGSVADPARMGMRSQVQWRAGSSELGRRPRTPARLGPPRRMPRYAAPSSARMICADRSIPASLLLDHRRRRTRRHACRQYSCRCVASNTCSEPSTSIAMEAPAWVLDIMRTSYNGTCSREQMIATPKRIKLPRFVHKQGGAWISPGSPSLESAARGANSTYLVRVSPNSSAIAPRGARGPPPPTAGRVRRARAPRARPVAGQSMKITRVVT